MDGKRKRASLRTVADPERPGEDIANQERKACCSTLIIIELLIDQKPKLSSHSTIKQLNH
jgi:hypothetical protein